MIIYRRCSYMDKKYKFKIGERVKVRKDLEIGKDYHMLNNPDTCDEVTEDMIKHLGKEATVMDIKYGKYYLDIDPFHNYTDEMLKKFVDVKSSSEYKSNDEVENLVEHMLEMSVKQQIDYALDVGDKELFYELTNKLVAVS